MDTSPKPAPNAPCYKVMARAIVEEMKALEPDLSSVQFGKTKVFYRGPQDRFLEVSDCELARWLGHGRLPGVCWAISVCRVMVTVMVGWV